MDLGSFGAWCRMVRNPLIWAGCADPAVTMERLRSDDPALGDLETILSGWHAEHGGAEMLLTDVVRAAKMAENDLREALLNVANSRSGEISARRLGHYLRRHQDRIVGDLKIVQCGRSQGSALWAVRRAA